MTTPHYPHDPYDRDGLPHKQYPQKRQSFPLPHGQTPGYVPSSPLPQSAYSEQEIDMPTRMMMANVQYHNNKKDTLTTWLLWLFTGIFGGHRFYLGDYGMGLGLLLTGGGLGIWALADALFIQRRLRVKNHALETDIFLRHGLTPPSWTQPPNFF